MLVEEGDALAAVSHYIHLNPVRAGVVPVASLRHYQASSYPYLWRRQARPPFLQPQWTLLAAGQLADTPAGWNSYREYLAWEAESGPFGKSDAYINLSCGWALGSAEFMSALLRDQAVARDTRAWEATGVTEVRELQWRRAMQRALSIAAKTEHDLQTAQKSAPWKLAIACWIKANTQAPNAWLSSHLALGNRFSCSSNLTRYRRQLQPTDLLWKALTQQFSA